MLKTDQVVRMYEDLAYIYDRQDQPRMRDWFLILAADAAYSAGWENEAERLRAQLLAYNPHHLLKPFASFGEALRSVDIESYIADLRRSYPPETAEHMLENHRPSYLTSAREEPVRPEKNSESPKPAKAASREPPIYRMEKEKSELTEAPPPTRKTSPAPLPAPETAPAPTRPAAAARPTRSKKRKPAPISPDWRSPVTSLKSPASGDKDLLDDAGAASRLIASFMFCVVFLVSLALAVYLLIRPFLPE